MNEYLGRRATAFGAPHFTDVFPPSQLHLYRDTPLSPTGKQQALHLRKTSSKDFTDLDLIVVSPLRRALQTLHLGLPETVHKNVPIIAHPAAAERLYLISDIGSRVEHLQEEFPYVDFSQVTEDCWWYEPSKNKDKPYIEWRPTGKSQKYACPGEPEEHFNSRMAHLHSFLNERTEKNIGVVCHHGVIDRLLGVDFDNCQYKKVAFEEITKRFQ